MTKLLNPTEQILVAEYHRFQLTWADVRRFLRLYTWTILLVFLFTVISTYVVLSFYSDRFETTAKLLVKIGRETVDPPPTASGRGGSLVTTGIRPQDVVSEVQILTSQDLVERVVDDIGLDKFKVQRVPPTGFIARAKFEVKQVVRSVKAELEATLVALGVQKQLNEKEKIVLGLMEDFSVNPDKETDVITVKLRTPDPELGNAVLRAWISAYLNRRLQVRQNLGVQEFLKQQVGGSKDRLAAAEKARDSWKLGHGLSQTLAQKESLIRQIREQKAAYDQTLGEHAAVEAQLVEANQMLARTPRNVRASEVETANPPMQIYRNEMAGLELQKSKLLSKYEPQSERVKLLDDEITRLKGLINQEQSKQISQSTLEINPLVKSLEARIQEDSIRLRGLKERTASLSVQVTALTEELANLESADTRLVGIERERSLAEDAYFGLVRREREADIDSELDRSRLSNVSILSDPSASIEPVFPKRILILEISLAAGLILGILLSLLLELMNDRVRSADELSRITNLPFLGSVRGGEMSAS